MSNLLSRDPPVPRPPAPGELQVAVLIGADTFVGWIPEGRIDAVMDALELRFRKGASDRTSVASHAGLRHLVGAKLRSAETARDFGEWVASACVWLALRHPSHGATLRREVDALTPSGCVLTCSIAEDKRVVRDTSWGFTVGRAIHDSRPALAREPAESMRLLSADELEALDGVWAPTPDPRRPPSEWTPGEEPPLR